MHSWRVDDVVLQAFGAAIVERADLFGGYVLNYYDRCRVQRSS